MNAKVKRTVLLLAVAIILFTAAMLFTTPKNAVWMDAIRGASAGLALAGTISFLILLVDVIKSNKRTAR